MSNNTSSIVSKVWSFCNPLRDVGVGYEDYFEYSGVYGSTIPGKWLHLTGGV